MSSVSSLPPLRHISADSFPSLSIPTQKIHVDKDIETWRTTQSYRDYSLFIRRLSESVVGIYSLQEANISEAVHKTITLLNVLDSWIDEIPPLESPQRFGNLSFRRWGERLHSDIPVLLASLLPPELHSTISKISPYLLSSFGSFGRMDYGTGHEAAFMLWLLCLSLLGFFNVNGTTDNDAASLILIVFSRYSTLCWRLQDIYRLEPAGSHGVWGLDDSSFLGYVFGSAQLRDQTEVPVSAFLEIKRPPPSSPILLTSSNPHDNLFFAFIRRIHVVKNGPFHEHSSQLHNIGKGVASWHKVHTGLLKMYDAEVLGKRVVVQHIPLGGILEWDASHDLTSSMSKVSLEPPNQNQATKVPWAAAPSSKMSASDAAVWTAPPVRAPWAASTATPEASNSTTYVPMSAPWATKR